MPREERLTDHPFVLPSLPYQPNPDSLSPGTCLSNILETLSSFPVLALGDTRIQDAYVGLLTAVLAADTCEMAVWAAKGKGRAAVERAWEVCVLTFLRSFSYTISEQVIDRCYRFLC